VTGRGPNAQHAYELAARRARVRAVKRAIAWMLVIAWIVFMYAVAWLACRAIFG